MFRSYRESNHWIFDKALEMTYRSKDLVTYCACSAKTHQSVTASARAWLDVQ